MNTYNGSSSTHNIRTRGLQNIINGNSTSLFQDNSDSEDYLPPIRNRN